MLAGAGPPVARLPAVVGPGHTTVVLLLMAVSAASLLGALLWVRRGPASGRVLLLATALVALVGSSPGVAAGASATQVDFDTVLTPMVLPLVVAVLARAAWVVVTAVVGALLSGPVRALVHDPFLDVTCDRCGHGALTIWPHPTVADALTVVGALLVAAALLATLWRGPRTVELLGVAGCFAAYLMDVGDRAPIVLGAALGAVSVSRELRLAWMRRRQALGLVAALDANRDLTTTLRSSLGDPGLLVTFADLDGQRDVDSQGRKREPGAGQLTTDLLVGGVVVARVHHAAATQLPDLEQALDGTARLMLVNEKLTAQLAARVRDVTQAREYVVERAVTDRRALERDLHDGVQQQLLALALDLRLALADPANTPVQAEAFSRALLEVQRAFDDVRDISHGVIPPLLATRGLGAAVTSMVRRLGASVELGELPEGRFALPVEEATFAVVAEAVTRGASSVRVVAVDDALVVRAEGAGTGVDGVLPDLVSAVGGALDLTGATIEAVLPCG